MPQLPPRRAMTSAVPAPVAAPEPAVPLFQTPVRSLAATSEVRASGTTMHFKKPPLTSRMTTSEQQATTTTTTYGTTDPLTPGSRLTLDSTMAPGRSSASTYSSFRESRTAMFLPAAAPQEPLSPNSMLLNTLDAVSQMSVSSNKAPQFTFESRSSSSLGLGSSYSQSSVATTKTRTTTMHMTATSAASSAPSHVFRLGTGDHGHGGDIFYLLTRIRIRAGNISCLRCHSQVNAKTNQLVSSVDAGGAGFDVDEIFVLVNVTLRSDEGRVKYTDTFISIDGTAITTKKGPIMSNAEKWRLGEKDEFFGKGTLPLSADADSSLAPGVRNAQRTLQSGNRIVLKSYALPYVLCVEHEHAVSLRDVKDMTGFEVWEITKANIPRDGHGCRYPRPRLQHAGGRRQYAGYYSSRQPNH
ncbi:hypothetical protein SPRG_08312 [Saprolegnia parasitica CBS 223.65]|uniref:Uncharacterized protein n=1 Tax=Saprolegnia parasitica (strain CBS 223.65) TaxID=695850 RepID=A0A067CHH1_SAPPC|nr:hypothetical protein SPRG_08312 [Saprolegnia parasitica CBS 223.65]KDO26237.1 hypothetical protein SPRG_08312 [Saprolegnia parasitica CBS 223.65]|eukprot:XP_012202946.1 hypothetical protein SPRG_08312 [Saprolegnia parasitica CBS 223.65]